MRPSWGLMLFAMASLLPASASLLYALLYSVGVTGLFAGGYTSAHWIAVLGSSELWSSLGLSSMIAGTTVVLSGSVGLALALGLRRSIDRGLLAWSLHVPLSMPGVLAALLVFMLFSAGGWMPRLLAYVGWTPRSDQHWSLVQDPYGLGIVLAHVFLATPFLTLTFRSLYLSERVESLISVAASLGANASQHRWRVAVPVVLRQARPTLAVLFIVVLGSYEIPLLLGRQSPQMISVLVMRKYARFDLADKPAALAVAVLYSVLVFVLLTLMFRARPRGSSFP